MAEMSDQQIEQLANRVVDILSKKQGGCSLKCNLDPEAQGQLSHFMGMVKDIGGDNYSMGIEVMRDNQKYFTRFRHRVDKVGQGIAWLIIAGVITGVGVLVSEGVKTTIRTIKGP